MIARVSAIEGCRVFSPIHDGYYAECPDHTRAEVEAALADFMESLLSEAAVTAGDKETIPGL